MKNLFKVLAITLAGIFAVGFTACNNGGGTSLTLSTASISFGDEDTASRMVTVSGADWTATTTDQWITLSQYAGTAGTSFAVTVAVNEGAARQGYITVSDVNGNAASKTVSVNQLAAGSTPTLVSSIELNEDVLTVMTGSTATLTATVYPSDATNQTLTWTSSDNTKATVVDGVITGIADGTVTITATAADASGITATASVTVSWAGNVWFKTDTQWTVGSMVWSDAVMAERCRKEAFDGGVSGGPYKADCRSNVYFGTEENPDFGDLFSIEAIAQYGDQLCPDGWRVPAGADIDAVYNTLGGSGYAYTDPAIFGQLLSGYCYPDGSTSNQGNNSWLLSYDNDGNPLKTISIFPWMVMPETWNLLDHGLGLRCIKE